MRVEASEITWVRCDHFCRSLTSGERHRGVDDIGRTGHSAELSRCSCSTIIENEHLAQRRSQQAGEPRLSRPVSPDLSDDPGRHKENVSVVKRSSDDCDYATLVSFETDKRSGV